MMAVCKFWHLSESDRLMLKITWLFAATCLHLGNFQRFAAGFRRIRAIFKHPTGRITVVYHNDGGKSFLRPPHHRLR